MDPSQFKVNEAWIAFQINYVPVCTEQDGDFNIIALMDASSLFILGSEFVSVMSEPDEMASKRLLAVGESHKDELPKILLVSKRLAAGELPAEAQRQGIEVKYVSEEELRVFVREARDGYAQYIGAASLQ